MVIKNQDMGKISLDPENVSEAMSRSRSASATMSSTVLSVHHSRLSHLALQMSSASLHTWKWTQKWNEE